MSAARSGESAPCGCPFDGLHYYGCGLVGYVHHLATRKPPFEEMRATVAEHFSAPNLVNQVAVTLIAAWQLAEGEPVTVSRVATFADMARAVVEHHRLLPDTEVDQ